MAAGASFWYLVGGAAGLVLFAGLMSGLTLGLMSTSPLDLELAQRAGGAREAAAARKVAPLVARPHLLLVTLLLWNAASMELLPLVLDQLVGKIAAVGLSVSAVLIFGEIVPQAVCSKFGLQIGAAAAPLVWALIAVTSVLAWPLSKLLDMVLGEHQSALYRRAEMKALVGIHRDGGAGAGGSGAGRAANGKQTLPFLHPDEGMLLEGAMALAEGTASAAMTPLEHVFSLPNDAKMDRETLELIVARGHSRVPLHEPGEPNGLRSLLLVKMLLLREQCPPSSDGEANSAAQPRPAGPVLARDVPHTRPLPRFAASLPLYDALNIFQSGGAHMALVVADGDEDEESPTALGIITLEDVLEELLQEEIVDETDEYADVTRKDTPLRGRGAALLRSRSGRRRYWGPTHSVGTTPGTTPATTPQQDRAELRDIAVVPSPALAAPSSLGRRQRSGGWSTRGRGSSGLDEAQMPLLGNGEQAS